MCPSKFGVIGYDDIATLEFAFPDLGLCAYAGRHTTKMNGKMGGYILLVTFPIL